MFRLGFSFIVVLGLVFLSAACQTAQPTATVIPSRSFTAIPTRTATLTGVPTAAPTKPIPTATSIPPSATVSPPLATAKQRLNVRAGPGTTYPILAKLEVGKSAPIIGRSADDNWWQIAFPSDSERGWVAAEFITVSGLTDQVAVLEIPTVAARETPRATTAPRATSIPASVNLIAFQSARNGGNFDIYTIKPDGTDERRLTDSPGNDQFPSWSPDGRMIAFSSDRDGQNEIYVMNADGSNQTRIAPHSEEDLVPRWSHDGKSIAFFSTRDGKSIFVMNPDGSNVRKVITNENITFDYGAFRLAWSPDDTMLAYTVGEPGDQTLYLYVINLDGTLVQRFSDLSATEWKWFESFSPDGRYQIIRTVGFGPQEVFIVDADTQANRRKLADGAEGRWSPR